jgi:hypothetical protein
MLYIYIFYLFTKIFNIVTAHGYMEYPIQRSSAWRIDKTAPINYNDNGLNCGWKLINNKSQCGICGDDINAKTPRLNEIGGKYYTGKIVQVFHNILTIKIKITANHKGYFEFYICNLDENIKETPECFKKINKKRYRVLSFINYYIYRIPTKIKCNHCILQWVWVTNNNGGAKNNEMYINCADIAIQ